MFSIRISSLKFQILQCGLRGRSLASVGAEQVELGLLLVECFCEFVGADFGSADHEFEEASVLVEEELSSLGWRVIDWGLILRTVRILNRSKLLNSLNLNCTKLTLITERQEIMKEKLKLVPIFSIRLNRLALLFIPLLNLLVGFVVQLIQRLRIFAKSQQLFGAQHENQNATKVKVEKVTVLPTCLLL